MLGEIIKNSALRTKMTARRGKWLTDKDYKAMSGLGSVFEIAEYLCNSPSYRDLLDDMDPKLVHRGELEERLKLCAKNEIYAVMPFLDMKTRAFFKVLDIKDEIEGIKFCARRMFSGSEEHFDNRNMRLYFANSGEVEFSRLLMVRNFDEFVDALSDTRYKDIFLSLKSDYARQTLFNVETILDMFYSRTLSRYLKRYTEGKDLKILSRLYGTEIDLLNISAIIRAKRYYKIEEEEIYAVILLGGHRLKPKDISRMVKAIDDETLMAEIANTPYKKVFENADAYFEGSINKYLYNMHRRLLREEPYTNASVMSYICLKGFEIKNIIKIIEGVRYGLSQAEIEKYIQ